jgi:Sec-independent protein translocase protein TatA
MEFGLAMKASKKHSIKETAETHKTLKNKKLKTQDANKEVVAQQEDNKKKADDEADDDDFQSVFMDNFSSSGFFNHSF